MSPSFAKDQPTGFQNYVKNIAIVGAGGRCGKYIVEALVNQGKHHITALTRPNSAITIPDAVHETKSVDYDDHNSLVSALQGQDVLLITMSVAAPAETQQTLIDAAVEANVKWIMPSEWGVDMSKEGLAKDSMMGDRLLPIRAYIKQVGQGKTHWIALCSGFWYEFSLGGTEARYGFDFEKKALTFIDDGETKINTSTWPQVGRAAAGLLCMKVFPDDEEDLSPCLSRYANTSLYISSFFVSQRDMFDSVLRVMGDKEGDWTVSHETAVERFNRGKKGFSEGNRVGLGIMLYTRVFYKDGSGEFNDKLDNEMLGLPEESLDEATRIGIEMAIEGRTNTIR